MSSLPPLTPILNGTPADASQVDGNFGTLADFVGVELINRDGTVAMTAELTLSSSTPTDDLGAASKGYVDTVVGDFQTELDALSARSGVGHVVTSQTTSSNSYTDLATAGPAVTLTTGTLVRVTISGYLTGSASATDAYMTCAVSGATTISATTMADSASPGRNLVLGTGSTTARLLSASQVLLVTAGSNVFTAKYRAALSQVTFSTRTIFVERLN